MAITLILIPKVKDTKEILDFRPISLGSFSSKIISKILANRLSLLLHRIVNEEQFGFVKDRQTHESIAQPHEMVYLDTKMEGGNIIFKFDMSKAYDRLKWRFLLKMLRAMGFSPFVQDFIFRTLHNIWYSVSINGVLGLQFLFSGGVRQGDPLSPLLFIMARQILSFNLKRREQNAYITPYKMGRRVTVVSHLLSANDMFLFTNVRIRSV